MSSVFGINDYFVPLDLEVVSLAILIIAITVAKWRSVQDEVVVL